MKRTVAFLDKGELTYNLKKYKLIKTKFTIGVYLKFDDIVDQESGNVLTIYFVDNQFLFKRKIDFKINFISMKENQDFLINIFP